MKQTTVVTIRRILALYFCFGFGVVVPGVLSAKQEIRLSWVRTNKDRKTQCSSREN